LANARITGYDGLLVDSPRDIDGHKEIGARDSQVIDSVDNNLVRTRIRPGEVANFTQLRRGHRHRRATYMLIVECEISGTGRCVRKLVARHCSVRIAPLNQRRKAKRLVCRRICSRLSTYDRRQVNRSRHVDCHQEIGAKNTLIIDRVDRDLVRTAVGARVIAHLAQLHGRDQNRWSADPLAIQRQISCARRGVPELISSNRSVRVARLDERREVERGVLSITYARLSGHDRRLVGRRRGDVDCHVEVAARQAEIIDSVDGDLVGTGTRSGVVAHLAQVRGAHHHRRAADPGAVQRQVARPRGGVVECVVRHQSVRIAGRDQRREVERGVGVEGDARLTRHNRRLVGSSRHIDRHQEIAARQAEIVDGVDDDLVGTGTRSGGVAHLAQICGRYFNRCAADLGAVQRQVPGAWRRIEKDVVRNAAVRIAGRDQRREVERGVGVEGDARLTRHNRRLIGRRRDIDGHVKIAARQAEIVDGVDGDLVGTGTRSGGVAHLAQICGRYFNRCAADLGAVQRQVPGAWRRIEKDVVRNAAVRIAGRDQRREVERGVGVEGDARLTRHNRRLIGHSNCLSLSP